MRRNPFVIENELEFTIDRGGEVARRAARLINALDRAVERLEKDPGPAARRNLRKARRAAIKFLKNLGQ